MANLNNEVLVCLAMEKANGINKTTPTSTNKVMPQSKPISTIMISVDSQRQRCRERAIRSAAPEISIILPKMVPSAMTVARKPSVLPMPFSMALIISSGCMFIANPTKKLARSNAKKGCNLNFRIVKMIKHILVNKIPTSKKLVSIPYCLHD